MERNNAQRAADLELTEYTSWLIETYGEPSADDRAWVKRVITDARSDT